MPDFKTLRPVQNQPDFSTLKPVGNQLPLAGLQQSSSLADTVWSGIGNKQVNEMPKIGGKPLVGGLVGSLLSPEINLGKEIGAALGAPAATSAYSKQSEQLSANLQTAVAARNRLKEQGIDTTKADAMIADLISSGMKGMSAAELYPNLNDTTGEVLGNVAGTALDIASFGSYGAAAKGAKTGSLLAKSAEVAAQPTKQALSQTLKTIGKETAGRSLVGGATGYGYDVAGNLQQGETGFDAFKPGLGTLLGASVPVAIGGVRAGIAITKDSAPRFINSLIKPRQADFSYGKDPGRTVSELGITGNSLPDFQKNITAAKQDIGQKIGNIMASPENAAARIDVSAEIAKIDDAIAEAAKGGKGNQSVVTALQNAKDAILFEHQVNTEGVIEKIGSTPRNLSTLSPQEAFDLKQLVSGQTKFTGNPSDDKTVNAVLKRVYGGIKEKINTAVSANSPEITRLNQQYADLTSAELATLHRDQILRRSDLISMPVKVGTVTGALTALATGGAAIPVILASISAGVLDKALQSTTAKTHIAAWLGSETPSAITKVMQQNPGIRQVLYRAFPKLASQLGNSEQQLQQE